jgi:hypothetical protein
VKNFFGDKLNINRTKENTSSSKIKPLRYIEPTDQQSTDQPTTSAQSNRNNIFQSIEDVLDDILKYKTPIISKDVLDKLSDKMSRYKKCFVSPDNREKIKEEYHQACIVLDACKNRYKTLDNQKKENSYEPLIADQEKFLEVFKKASEYKDNAAKYKDQRLIDQDPKSFIENLEKVNQELKKNKLVQEEVFAASVKTDSSGTITIDVAKFVPSAIDLSKLDLSNQERDKPDTIEIDISHVDISKYKNNIPDNDIFLLSYCSKISKNALKSGWNYNTYEIYPDLYGQVLEYYLKAQIYLRLQKTDFTPSKFKEFSCYFSSQMEHLINANNCLRDIRKISQNKAEFKASSSFSYNSAIKDQSYLETQSKKDELKALFSDNSTEKIFAEEKYIKDSNELFEQEAKIAKELFEWTKTFTKRFDVCEDWVQAGMKQQLGIGPENFHESHQQLNNFIESPKLAENTIVPPDTQTYKELLIVNAKFKAIRELLNDGIPIEYTPRQINGLERVKTPGNEMNCLIHALLKVGKPEWDMSEIAQIAPSIRKNLATKMKEKFDEYTQKQEKAEKEGIYMPMFSERCKAVQSSTEMLDLGSYDGQELINYLREQDLIEPNRGVLIYKLEHNRKIQCTELVSPSHEEKQKPYSLFLYQDFHFEAMIEPQMDKEKFIHKGILNDIKIQ